jgi:hypothetical protein
MRRRLETAAELGNFSERRHNEVPARYTIAQAGVEIYCYSIALDREPDEIAQQIEAIVAMSVRGQEAQMT